MKTKEINKVLIAMDYDQSAQKVAEEGYALAKTMGAEVILLHVIVEPMNYTSPGHVTIMGFAGDTEVNTLQIDNVEALKEASVQYLDKAKHHLGDETIKTIVEEGDLAESILKVAKKMHIDVIIMGSHSKKWLENILLGSVTEKVLNLTTIPLFIIPTKKH